MEMEMEECIERVSGNERINMVGAWNGLSEETLMKIMSDFREAMWGLVQVRISDLDFDFLGYANQHFLRLLQRALNPNWEAWLKEFR